MPRKPSGNSRHDYFRRILCNIFGQEMDNGLLPGELPWIGQLVQDICYYNVKGYINFTQNQL
ncbi:glucuronate isomerase [Chitinophaga sp.]|uniref:glucuronate isomerase n=1 Tax=Chitinophaga sp. TaxID=1869181 RepID=UPI0031DD3B26